MDLLITLGHSSSAILIKDGRVLEGYEEERHNREKGCSVFPIMSIKKCLKDKEFSKENNTIYVSHWFDDFNFRNNNHDKIQNKYWNEEYIKSIQEKFGFNVKLLNNNFTHHDAHAYAVKSFYDYHSETPQDSLILVADGFGNKQEVISLYNLKYKDGKGKISSIKKIKGYSKSLGLFYQYATSFCGMKENQDEYKFLGYESHIEEVLGKTQAEVLKTLSLKYSNMFIDSLEEKEISVNSDSEYINLKDLAKVKEFYNSIFNDINNSFAFNKDDDNFSLRIVIGNFIQTVIENVCIYLVEKYSSGSLLVNGGIFYNVKLNNRLARISDSFCVFPLAGDQGAAIGLYANDGKSLDYSDLFWGKRTISKEVETLENLPENVEVYDNKLDMVKRICSLIKDNSIPQIIVGNMEFGPRALCHTTTLSIPTKDNVETINSYNKRNTVMPMAPVMLRKNLGYFFNKEQYAKTVGSDKYMILTYDYKIPYNDLYSGIMHKYPSENLFSGRPQVIEDNNTTISLVLEELDSYGFKALVNTSYNIHGKPIVFSVEDAIKDFSYQLVRAEELSVKKPFLLIGEYKDE